MNESQTGFGPPNQSTPRRLRTSGLAAFATLPLMHQPGEKWMYNSGSYVLGCADRARLGPAAGEFPARIAFSSRSG